MIRSLYNFGLGIALVPVVLPLYVWARFRRPRFRETLPQRLGCVKGLPAPPRERPIWLHGVSLGEVRTLRPIVEAWQAGHPDRPILVSASTETGLDAAHALFDQYGTVTPFPLDAPWAVRAILEYWRPALVAILETEIWPNFFWECAAREIPLCMISGRVSARTLRRARMLAPLWKSVLASGTAYAMQTESDADRLCALGAQREQVYVLGNLKWDAARVPDLSAIQIWRRDWGIEEGVPLLLWGSTHEPEERLAIDVWRRLRSHYPRLRLCVAPRHPERFEVVAGMLQKERCSLRRRTNGPASDWDVLLLDTIGELAAVYALATVAIMGGTFAPVGGHNIVEVLAAGAPLVVGPHTQNVRQVVETADMANALVVANEHTLVSALDGLLADVGKREMLVQNGRALLAEHQGTARRLVEFLERCWPVASP